jgi:protein-S-isoprenylcysteine O-methyltransferase Ste14
MKWKATFNFVDRTLLINGLTFLAVDLLIYWKLSDPRSKEERFKAYLKPKSILIGFFIFIFFALNYLSAMYFPLPPSGFDDLINLLGILTFFAGMVIAVWAKMTMGKVWGIPAEHSKARQNKLIRSGPFKYSRNPIYVGLIMVLAGYGLATQSVFTFLAIIPIFYFNIAAQKEEELLEKHFKEEYLKYKKEVPRFF